MRRAFALPCYLSAALLGGCRALQPTAGDGGGWGTIAGCLRCPRAPPGEDLFSPADHGGGHVLNGEDLFSLRSSSPRRLAAFVEVDQLEDRQADLKAWWEEESQTQMLQIPPTWRDSQDRTGGRPSDKRPEEEVTAIVTHAGKSSQEFIDMAVMLAVSLKRHVPDYPRFAIAVRGMSETNQETLAKAGWHVVLVDDWSELHHRENAPVAQFNLNGTIGASPPRSTTPSELGLLELGPELEQVSALDSGEPVHGQRFFWRWGDAFEKLNMFRLPFGRVLYLDADTYVMNDKLGFLLNSTELPEGNIGMVHDGCKTGAAQDGEYNSGVMLFKPDRGMFTKLLKVVGGVMSGTLEEKPDQPIINQVYKGQVTALDRKYNCIDLTGRTAAAECAQNCKEVVVTHFTGLPKPATANAKFLDIVRRPYSPILHCFNTNHGSCKAWSGYYCDVLRNKQSLTKGMQNAVEATGSCCHTPPQTDDPPECRDGCTSQVKVDGWMSMAEEIGVFNKTNLPSDPIMNAGRPVYIGPKRAEGIEFNGGLTYMFYLKPYGNWVIGADYKTTNAWAYSHERAMCPSDTARWNDAQSRDLLRGKVSVVPGSPITADMVLDLQSGSGEWLK